MKAYEFMSTKMETIDAERTVYDAIERMVDKRISALLVKFPGDDKNNGVVTARDVVFRVLAQERDPNTTKIAEIASRPLMCMDREMTLEDAATLMEKHNIARVYVCDGESVVGVLSLLDVMAGALVTRARKGHVS